MLSASPATPLRRAAVAAVGAALLGAFAPALAWDAGRMSAAAASLGPRAIAAAQELQSHIAAAEEMDEAQRLKSANDFVNRRVAFRGDSEVWGQPDFWASPLQTLGRGAGDCEDYAIAKYFTLLAQRVPAARMRLVYVRALVDGAWQAHMVLAHYPSPPAEPMILDNLISEMKPASQRTDLMPVFSFNSEGLWQGVGQTSAGDPLARLSRWRQVLARAREEGFLSGDRE